MCLRSLMTALSKKRAVTHFRCTILAVFKPRRLFLLRPRTVSFLTCNALLASPVPIFHFDSKRYHSRPQKGHVTTISRLLLWTMEEINFSPTRPAGNTNYLQSRVLEIKRHAVSELKQLCHFYDENRKNRRSGKI